MKILYPPFLKNIKKNQLIENDDIVILGFSGGKDSITLFYLLQELKKDIDIHIILAYFNHKIRTDANKEQQWINNFSQSQKVELVIGSKNVIEFKNKYKLNLEHAASISRYHFFRQLSSKHKNAKIATAHTKSDLTETFFIKLFRGSGLQGLSTIYSRKENTIIRPLLVFDQEEILSFLKRNNFQFYKDYSNDDDEFLRNKIRHHIIPEVEKIEPEIHRHIFKTVNIIQEEYNYFSRLAKEILIENLILGKILPAKILQNYHLSVQRHIIREYLRLLKNNLLNIDFEHIEAIRTRHMKIGGLAIPGIELSFHKGFIYPNTILIPDYNLEIPYPDSLKIDKIRKKLIIKKLNLFKKPENNERIIISQFLVQFPLTIRNPQPKDKYIKINSSINQKVFEMIRTFGIPSELRNLCPVLINGDGEIIWVFGSPVAEKFKVKNQDEETLLEISLT